MRSGRAILPSMLRIRALKLSLLSIVTPRYFNDLQQVGLIVLFSCLKFRYVLAAFILGGSLLSWHKIYLDSFVICLPHTS